MSAHILDNRVMVKFIANCSPYASGERAAFPRIAADRLVSRKVAIYDKDAAIAEEVDEDDNDEQNDGNGTANTLDGSGDGAGTESKKRKGAKGKSGKRKRVKAED